MKVAGMFVSISFQGWLWFVLLLLGYAGCSLEDREVEDDTKRQPKIQISATEVSDNEIPTLESSSKDKANQNFDDELFGRFFCDRAEFYVIANPLSSVYSAKVFSVTLFYLDGELRKSKYVLASDITPDLIKELGGKFRVVGLDEKNRHTLKTEPSVTTTNDGVNINAKLDNFEIRWSFGDKEVRYRVNKNSSERFVYTHKVKDFEKELLALEKYC